MQGRRLEKEEASQGVLTDGCCGPRCGIWGDAEAASEVSHQEGEPGTRPPAPPSQPAVAAPLGTNPAIPGRRACGPCRLQTEKAHVTVAGKRSLV